MRVRVRIIGAMLAVAIACGISGAFAVLDAGRTADKAGSSQASVMVTDAAAAYRAVCEELRSTVARFADTNAAEDRQAVLDTVARVKAAGEAVSGAVPSGFPPDDAGAMVEAAAEMDKRIVDALDRLKVRRDALEAVTLGVDSLSSSLPKARDLMIAQGEDAARVARDMEGKLLALLSLGARYGAAGAAADAEAARARVLEVKDALDAAKSFLSELSRSEKEPIRNLTRDLDLFRDGIAQYEGAGLGYRQALDGLNTMIGQSVERSKAVSRAAMTRTIDLSAALSEDSRGTARMMIVSTLAAMAFAAAMAMLLASNIVRPIVRLNAAMGAVGAGRFDAPVSDTARVDEIGTMARTLECVRADLAQAEALRRRQAEMEEEGRRMRDAAVSDMARDVERDTSRAVGVVSGETAKLDVEADSMSAAASRMAEAAVEVETAAGESLLASQHAAMAAEELAASIQEISAQVVRSSELVRTATADGREAVMAMEALTEAVERVGRVVELITDVARRTNLLALNATIEAMRAGDAGRGFTVVAGEVKQLAARTADSTNEITRIIADIRDDLERCRGAVTRIEDRIQSVDEVSTGISAAVEEQTAATAEIAQTINRAAGAVQSVSDRIGLVTMDARATGDRAAALRGLTSAMVASVEGMREEIVSAVRKAASVDPVVSDVETSEEPGSEIATGEAVMFDDEVETLDQAA